MDVYTSQGSTLKSFKHHWRRVVGDHTLTYEEFQTLAAQIEVCLNSRPLSPLTSDPDDLKALIPGHFLIGATLVSLPEPYFSTLEIYITPRQRWHLVQKMLADFWKLWSREVLLELQRRVKWLEPNGHIQENDLVILTGELKPPSKWLLVRIIQCHPGQDGLV